MLISAHSEPRAVIVYNDGDEDDDGNDDYSEINNDDDDDDDDRFIEQYSSANCFLSHDLEGHVTVKPL